MTSKSSVLMVAGLASSLINFRGDLLAAMRAEGHSVTVAAPDLSSDAETASRLRALGVEIADVPFERGGLNPISDLRAFLTLIRLMRHVRPTHLFAYTVKPVVWGMLAARVAGIPCRYAMITGLGYAFTGKASGKRLLVQRVVQRLYKVALAGAAKVFFQNPDDQAVFRNLGLLREGGRSVIVNGSGVNVTRFAPEKMPEQPMRFLMIARLLGDKGLREYLAAASALKNRYPDAEFHLVGGTDSNPDAVPVEEVERCVQEGTISWHGATDDVRPFIAMSHVFVLPSYREGTPRAVLEAMAMGRPIVTTDAPGCRETVVHGDNGFLVTPRDVPSLVDGMERFLLNPDLVETMGKSARTVAVEKYDVQRVNRVMLKEMELA